MVAGRCSSTPRPQHERATQNHHRTVGSCRVDRRGRLARRRRLRAGPPSDAADVRWKRCAAVRTTCSSPTRPCNGRPPLRAEGRLRRAGTPAILVGNTRRQRGETVTSQPMYLARPLERAVLNCYVTMAILEGSPLRRSERRLVNRARGDRQRRAGAHPRRQRRGRPHRDGAREARGAAALLHRAGADAWASA